jgi:hypothetical protein
MEVKQKIGDHSPEGGWSRFLEVVEKVNTGHKGDLHSSASLPILPTELRLLGIVVSYSRKAIYPASLSHVCLLSSSYAQHR